MVMNFLLLAPLLFFSSWLVTGCLRHYALKKKVLDIPNQRSAHSAPMPRGGGLAFVLGFLVLLGVALWTGQVVFTTFIAIFFSAFLVASLGFVDDYFSLSAKWRFGGHVIAAGWFVYWMGGAAHCLSIPNVSFINGLFTAQYLMLLLNVGAVFSLVWWINLFNFMDGIDGLAAIETISICCCGSVLFALDGQVSLIYFPLLLAFLVLGFLVWNFPRARIFMGDVGSGFLGLLMGIFTLMAGQKHFSLLCAWFILNGVFLCDASLTLVRRLYTRQNIFQAHAQHVYQRTARHFNSHSKVSLSVGLINCCWLFPMAILVQQQLLPGLVGVVLSFIPLLVLAVIFNPRRCP